MPGISQTLLIAALDFGPRLQAKRVAEAIAKGLCDGGMPQPDLLPLGADDAYWPTAPGRTGGYISGAAPPDTASLDALDFDARMKAARALVIATPRLDEHTLLGSLTFELATRARQSGVPAYAVTAEDAIDRFDARVLDLQAVLVAGSARTLISAGRKLIEVV